MIPNAIFPTGDSYEVNNCGNLCHSMKSIVVIAFSWNNNYHRCISITRWCCTTSGAERGQTAKGLRGNVIQNTSLEKLSGII